MALLKIDGNLPPAHLMLGLILSSRLQPQYRARMDLEERNSLIEKALGHLQRASQLNPCAETFDAHGVGLTRAGRHAEAIERFQQALAVDSCFSPAVEHLGLALLEIGETEEAAVQLARAIALNPRLPVAHYELARIQKAAAGEAQASIAIIEGLLEQTTAAPAKVLLHFALARRHDDLNQYDDAFLHYEQANRLKVQLRRAQRGGSLSELGDTLIPRSIAVFDEAFFAARRDWGSGSRRPVFIVGMPRSGTTLVEQILSSHPEVYGAGELIDISDLCLSLPRRLSTQDQYPEAMRQLSRQQVQQMAEEYLAVLQLRDSHASLVTDKMPTNFRHLGLIGLLFPQARIIHLERDPLDVCVSCFRQNLEWPFCDLEAVGCYYRSYERLMGHWRTVVPTEILDVQYETLVEFQESETRRMLEFLGLAWNDRCLEFQSTPRPVRTPSKWQVRQPIYSTSVGAWRKYEKHLGILKRALG